MSKLFGWACVIALPVATIAIIEPARASTDAVIEGLVQDAIGRPLANATVVVHDPSGKTAGKMVTGPDGKFSFPVPFGDYTVEATAPGLVEDHQHIVVSSSQVEHVDLTLVATEEVVQIKEDWSVPPPPKGTGSVSTVTRQKLQELPGADDRPVTDVIATQPGFVVDALGNVYARGNHGNVQYQVDGIPVPDSVGSLFASTIPTRLINGLEIYTGGMPAEFGNRLGAVVNLQTRQASGQPEGAAQVRYGSYNTVEPGFFYTTTLGGAPADPATPTTGNEGTGVFVGGSFVYSQRALDAQAVTPVLHDDGSSGRLFARIDRQLTRCDRIELFGTYAHNRFQIPIDPTVAALDPANPSLVRPVDQFGNESPPFIPRDTNATETEDELFTAVSWQHSFGDDGTLQVAPYYKLSRGVLHADAEHALGPTADPGSVASDVQRTAHHAGAIAAYSIKLDDHLLKAGVGSDLLFGRTSFTSYTRDDDGGGGVGGVDSGRDRTNAITSGVYVQDHWSLGDLALDMGLRVDEQHVTLIDGQTDDAIGVSPRLGASYAFDKDWVAHVFVGVNWQPPAPLDAANAARALGVVQPGQTIAYDLKPETDLYSEIGIAARVAKPLRLGLIGWGRYAYNQLDDTAIGSTSLDSNYNFSRGRAAGLEGTAEMRVGPWLAMFANASYGFAEGKGIASAKYLFSAEDLANTNWQTLDHAQTWTGNGGATVRDNRFSATALVSYGSGLRTGPANDQHVPGHVTMDLSTTYTYSANGYPVKLMVDLENLFDEHYAYRIANGFVGSSYAPPRTVFVTLSLPLAAEPKGTKQ